MVQLLCAGLASVAFIALFVPAGTKPSSVGSDPTARQNARCLARFPLFWLGLGLVVYIVVQTLNPAYAFAGTGREWSLTPLDYIRWLPAGMELPAQPMNGWRFLLATGSVWLAICSLWVGIRRRKAMRILFWIFVVNHFAWAAVTLLQIMTDASGILWFYETPVVTEMARDPLTGELTRETQFYGLMINPNHAAALLNIGLVAAGAFFLYHLQWSQRKFARGGPHLVVVVMASVILAAAILAVSRAGTVVAIALMLLLVMCFAASLARRWREMGTPFPALVLFVGLVVVVSGLVWRLDWAHLDWRIQQTQRLIENPASELRFYLNKGTWRMIEDRPLFGWGAGSYRYRIPGYRQEIPELRVYVWQPYWDEEEGRVRHERYPAAITHAHNDFLQYPAELGLAGSGIIVLAFLWGAVVIVRNRRSVSTPWVFLFSGLVLVSAHAAVDFIFYIPGILAAWSILGVMGLKWIDRSREARARPGRVTSRHAGGRLFQQPP